MWVKLTSESGKRCLINMAYANVIEEFKSGCMIQFDPEFAAYVKEDIDEVTVAIAKASLAWGQE